jgi:hypothetical protein
MKLEVTLLALLTAIADLLALANELQSGLLVTKVTLGK